MAYLVVEYDGGKQKQCNFKDERDVDKLLEVLAKEQPQIHLLSAAGEQMLQKKEAEKASRKLPESELTDDEMCIRDRPRPIRAEVLIFFISSSCILCFFQCAVCGQDDHAALVDA